VLKPIPYHELTIIHAGALRVVEPDGRVRYVPKLLRSDGQRLVCLRDCGSRGEARTYGSSYVGEPSYKVPGELWHVDTGEQLTNPVVFA